MKRGGGGLAGAQSVKFYLGPSIHSLNVLRLILSALPFVIIIIGLVKGGRERERPPFPL